MASKDWSTWEEEIGVMAANKGVLCIPQYPEVKFFAGGVAKVTGTAWPDRVCAVQGLAFVLDAKTTKAKGRISMARSAKRHAWKDIAQFGKLVQAWECGVPAFYLVRWALYEEAEMFLVDGKSEWPYVCVRGEGLPLGGEGWFDVMLSEVMRVYGRR